MYPNDSLGLAALAGDGGEYAVVLAHAADAHVVVGVAEGVDVHEDVLGQGAQVGYVPNAQGEQEGPRL